MSQIRRSKTPIYISLSETRIQQIEELVSGWSSETRRFVLRRLHQHDVKRPLSTRIKTFLRRHLKPGDHQFTLLRDPRLLNDWHNRFEAAGSQDATEAWNRILARELSPDDYQYLIYLLEKDTIDTFVPESIREVFDKLYRTYVLKEYTEDPKVPRAPIILIIGNSGSGKTATVKQAVDQTIFSSEVRPVIDLKAKREEVLAEHPIWKSLEEIDPELAVRIERRKRRAILRFFSKLPLIRYLFRNQISHALSSLDEEGIVVDYAMITPNDYQTAWSGEPGNYLRKAMGDPAKLCLRHMEEAHSAFGMADQMSTVKSQQGTLIDTSNIILDEIIHGRRDCLLIATTDQPELLDPAIYRRFVERGLVIDVNELWEEPENLRQVVCLELRRKFRDEDNGNHRKHLTEKELDLAIEKLICLSAVNKKIVDHPLVLRV